MTNQAMIFYVAVNRYSARCGLFLSEITKGFGVPKLASGSDLIDIYMVNTTDEDIEYLCNDYDDVVDGNGTEFWWE